MDAIDALCLCLVALVAWCMGRYGCAQTEKKTDKKDKFNKDYLIGLNYLLTEQPDKAVDVFMKLLSVDNETVETHLALGHLFRKQGQIERAIRIHQNLIAKPQLMRKQRTQAILALGEDYLRVGVLDRAERLLLDVVASEDYQAQALVLLLDIYQQEKEWQKAIDMAQQYQSLTETPMEKCIAQYYCELAILAKQHSHLEGAFQYLKRALAIDRHCVRASLLQGEWEMIQQEFKAALKSFHRVFEQDPAYVGEALPSLSLCYQKLDQSQAYRTLLIGYLSKIQHVGVAISVASLIEKEESIEAAAGFMAEQLYHFSSLEGLGCLVELQLKVLEGQAKYHLQILSHVIATLQKKYAAYRCMDCGYAAQTLHWQCPYCHHWGTGKPAIGLES